MTEPINLEYILTEKEYVSAVQAFYSRTYHTKLWFYFSAVVFLSGLAVVRFVAIDNIVGMLLLVCGFAVLSQTYRAHFAMPREFFRRNPELHQSWILQFTEDGLFTSSSKSESRVEWSFFREIWETADFYFLLSGIDTPTIVLKRAFTSKAQEVEFRTLIKRKINPNIQRNSFFESVESDELQTERVLPQSPPDWR